MYAHILFMHLNINLYINVMISKETVHPKINILSSQPTPDTTKQVFWSPLCLFYLSTTNVAFVNYLSFTNTTVHFKHALDLKTASEQKASPSDRIHNTVSTVILCNLVKLGAFVSKHRHIHIWLPLKGSTHSPEWGANVIKPAAMTRLPVILMSNKETNLDVCTHFITALCWPGKPRMRLPELCPNWWLPGAFCFLCHLQPLCNAVYCQLVYFPSHFFFSPHN